MIKKSFDAVKEQKELTAYALFYFFLASGALKVVFGVIAGSKCLLVAGIFALFGVFIAVVSLVRIGRSHPGRAGRMYFNPDKLEFIIVLGTSMIITLSTSALLFSIGHMVFFHTLYPPQMLAAGVALATALASLGLMWWIRSAGRNVPEIDAREVSFLLNADFLLSIMTVVAVIIARNGSSLLDYACAILTAFFLIIYGCTFLKSAFKGLMDASGDPQTVGQVRALILRIRPAVGLAALRVSRSGHLLEIMVTLQVAGESSMKEAVAQGRKVRELLHKKFTVPHELLVGFVQKEPA
ncbi:MAG: cation transporter [Candidatus Omnitrophica bacterium]|nr:cation transporter [Candidatus Omnitrophota bacterium]